MEWANYKTVFTKPNRKVVSDFILGERFRSYGHLMVSWFCSCTFVAINCRCEKEPCSPALQLPMGRSGEVSECDCGPPIQVAVDITLCTGPGPVSA